MILLPSQIVDDLVYINADKSANLEAYDSPALTVDDSHYTLPPAAKTKS